MLGLGDPQEMLEAAQRAASSGDLATADQLLRGIARIQETELGPLHPELANTLNNLAIVAERTGRTSDAETFYRRAAAIASASLPPDHPMVIASHQNLEDFCHASGLPLDAPAFITPSVQDTELGLGAFASEDSAAAARPRVASPAATTPADLPLRAEAPPPPSSGRALRVLGWAALAALAVVGGAMFVLQPWSSSVASPSATTPTTTAPRTTPPTTTAPTATPQPPRATAPVSPPSGEPPRAAAPSEPAPPPTGATAKPPPAVSESGISLATAQLCQKFSTSGGSWRCDQAGDSVAPGPLVLYTRIKSPRNTAVVHRWYRGDTLQRSVDLKITASPNEGYRTYSRQTVEGGTDWRVEVRTAGGELLHEQRFAVR